MNPTFFVGLLVCVGGLIGYVKAGSMMSVIMGGAMGGLLLLAAYMMQSPSSARTGYRLSMAICVLLVIVMGMRFAKSGKFMPAGLVAITCSALLIFNSLVYFKL